MIPDIPSLQALIYYLNQGETITNLLVRLLLVVGTQVLAIAEPPLMTMMNLFPPQLISILYAEVGRFLTQSFLLDEAVY